MLFTFPSRYWYTIGQTGILRLTQRSGRIHTGFHEARATRDTATARPCAFGYGAITLYGPVSNPVRLTHGFLQLAAGASAPARPLPRHRYRNPRRVSHGTGLAIIRFRSPLLTEYPFLQVLRCFTSLRTPRTKLCGAGPQQPAGYPIRTPSDQSPVGGSPRPIAAPHVLHRYCLPRHPPYAHGNKPTNPAKKGATGPCHLHWNTLRQLIRSSKHHPHQQCGRLTKTLANTIHAPTRQAGTERFDKINSTNTPGTPHKGTPFMLASTLQLSNHHTTPPQTPTPQRTGPGRRERNTTPDKGPGGPGTQQHAPHHRPPTPQGRRRLDLFPASKGHHPATRPGKEASHHRRTTVRPQNSVERR